MSTITRRPPRWEPKRLARLTVDQYEAMVDSGVFTKRDQFTLIKGSLVTKVPRSPRHTFTTKNLARKLQGLIPLRWHTRIEDAVRLVDSKPEPDISIARGAIEDDMDRDPGPADLAMVIEVSASSILEDRRMAAIYGTAGIPVSWIVNMKACEIEVYTLSKRRGASGYGKPRVSKASQSVPVVIEDVEVGRNAVADILPTITPASGGNGA